MRKRSRDVAEHQSAVPGVPPRPDARGEVNANTKQINYEQDRYGYAHGSTPKSRNNSGNHARVRTVPGSFGTRPARRRFHIGKCRRREIMDKEHVKGAADKAKGAVKDAAGKVMGDKQMQAEGKVDKAKGEAHQALGDIKDAARKTQGS
jgi:uncharacterized protein YjbJ (UPF0337 family)